MASKVEWVKLSVDMLESNKILEILYTENGHYTLMLWYALITIAGKCNQDGALMFTEKIPYSIEKLQFKLNMTTRKLKTILVSSLNELENRGMVEKSADNIYYLPNWAEYQNVANLTVIREYERSRKHQQRGVMSGKSPVNVPDSSGKSPRLLLRDVRSKNREEEVEEESLTPFVKEVENAPLNDGMVGKDNRKVIEPSHITQALQSPNYQSLNKYRCFSPIFLATYAGVIAKFSESEMRELRGVLQAIDNSEFPQSPSDVVGKVARWIKEHNAQKGETK